MISIVQNLHKKLNIISRKIIYKVYFLIKMSKNVKNDNTCKPHEYAVFTK